MKVFFMRREGDGAAGGDGAEMGNTFNPFGGGSVLL